MGTNQTKGRIYSWPCQPGLLQMQRKHGMTRKMILDTTSKVVNLMLVQATLHRSVAILFVQQTSKRIQQYLTNINATNLHKVEQYLLQQYCTDTPQYLTISRQTLSVYLHCCNHEGLQVVWARTTHVGAATSSDGVYIVANYSPSGNYEGEYADNVKPEVAQSLSAEEEAAAFVSALLALL